MAVKKDLIKRFAYEYATTNKYHPASWWGTKYGVTGKAINNWLELIEVKEIVDQETISFAETVIAKARKQANVAMRELMKIVKMDKFTDVKRRACGDMLDLASVENKKSDSGKIKDKNREFGKMSNKDLNSAYTKLLRSNRRTKGSSSPAPLPGNDTVN